ncbi:hypothetical protein [Salibacterium qingdaonense]|uniref:Uncharacterized protein n=1 Tax=Salibacterium qingdaonense TaxID=266892 RepID=A0A1I4NY12_9BACI|nr:hypothetical protein [Salibacterium qingdaonense]SFM20421.1 hypothetical protein SAMN04488054_12143 [Salibacterium qingdaonense]
MYKVRRYKDVKYLQRILPNVLAEPIETLFLRIYKSQGEPYSLGSFWLPAEEALFILEAEDDVKNILDDPFDLEYVYKIQHNPGIFEASLQNQAKHERFLIVEATLDPEEKVCIQDLEDWTKRWKDKYRLYHKRKEQ